MPPLKESGIDQYGVDSDYPLLWARAKSVDYQERLGRSVSPLEKEIEAAMHELWMARETNARTIETVLSRERCPE